MFLKKIDHHSCLCFLLYNVSFPHPPGHFQDFIIIDFSHFDSDVLRFVFVYIFPACCLLKFWSCRMMSFISFIQILGYPLLRYFFCPILYFWNSNYMCVQPFNIFHRCQILCSIDFTLLYNFFLSCLQVYWSFFWDIPFLPCYLPRLQLTLSNKFHMSDMWIFISRI